MAASWSPLQSFSLVDKVFLLLHNNKMICISRKPPFLFHVWTDLWWAYHASVWCCTLQFHGKAKFLQMPSFGKCQCSQVVGLWWSVVQFGWAWHQSVQQRWGRVLLNMALMISTMRLWETCCQFLWCWKSFRWVDCSGDSTASSLSCLATRFDERTLAW